jgi:hypothetical protein
MALSTFNSFKSSIHNSYKNETPKIQQIWISNINSARLTINWTGIFNKVLIDNGTSPYYATKKRTIVQNTNTEYLYSIIPIINNENGIPATVNFQYTYSTPILNIESSSHVVNNETGTNSYKNGIYNISSSSVGIQENLESEMYNYNAFDNSFDTYWLNDYNNYSTNIANFVTTLQTSSPSWNDNSRSVVGEWLQIELPYKIQLYYYKLSFYNEYYSTKFYIAGSMNGIEWDAVDYRTNNSTNTIVNMEVLKSYSHFRFISKTNNKTNQSVIGIKNWYLNGVIVNSNIS